MRICVPFNIHLKSEVMPYNTSTVNPPGLYQTVTCTTGNSNVWVPYSVARLQDRLLYLAPCLYCTVTAWVDFYCTIGMDPLTVHITHTVQSVHCIKGSTEHYCTQYSTCFFTNAYLYPCTCTVGFTVLYSTCSYTVKGRQVLQCTVAYWTVLDCTRYRRTCVNGHCQNTTNDIKWF
jgi:hypothetical protein